MCLGLPPGTQLTDPLSSCKRTTSYSALLQSSPYASRNPEIFRVVESSRVLANFGAVFAEYSPKASVGVVKTWSTSTTASESDMMQVPSESLLLEDEKERHEEADSIFVGTRQAKRIDAFVSHVWSAPRWAKTLALLFYANRGIAAAAAVVAWLAAAALVVVMLGGGDPTKLGGRDLVPPLVWAPMAVFLLFFFYGHRITCGFLDESWWLDKLCIHQTRTDVQMLGLLALPEFVAKSSRIVILWSDTYFERLWCNAEVATFVSLHQGVDNVDFMPLWLAPWVLSTLLCDIVSITLWSHLSALPVDVGIWLETQLVSPALAKFLTPLLGIGLSLGTAYLPMVIPNLISFRNKISSHELMLSHINGFRLQDAKCSIDDDCAVIEAHVGQLFVSDCWANTPWDRLPDEVQAEALEQFNSFVRGKFNRGIRKRVGEVSRVPYSLALLAFLPLNFASLANVLGCDGADCEVSAHLQGYGSVPQYMCTNGVTWLVGILLIYPTTFAVMLMGLQACKSYFSHLSSQVVASCAAITGAYYYMGFLKGLASAIIVNTVTSTTAPWVAACAALLAALAAWSYLLFVADVSGDSCGSPDAPGCSESPSESTLRRIREEASRSPCGD